MIRSLQIRALHQGGVFGRAQAVSAGYTAGQIRNRIRRGQRREVLPRVYAATSTPLDPLAQFWAAHLSAGPVSVISHTTAARLWELPVPPDGLVHLSVPPGRRPRTGAPVRVHRVVVGDSDRAGIDGLPVTSRAATVLDCLPLLDRSDGAKLLDRAVQQGWLRPVHVERRLAESPGRHGNQSLRRLLATFRPGADSAAERLLHRLLRQHGIDGWRPQYAIRLPSGRIATADVPGESGRHRGGRLGLAHRPRTVPARSQQAERDGHGRLDGAAVHLDGPHRATGPRASDSTQGAGHSPTYGRDTLLNRVPRPQVGQSYVGGPSVGMPSSTPGVFGVTPAAQLSPARVRRWDSSGPSATRWCGAA